MYPQDWNLNGIGIDEQSLASSKLKTWQKIEGGDIFGLFPCPVVAASSGRELLHVRIGARGEVGERHAVLCGS